MNIATVKVNDLRSETQDLVIKVCITRYLRFKIWLAVLLIKCAAVLIDASIDIEINEN